MCKKIFTMGYLVGKQIAGMRRVKKEPVAYLYNGVRLPPLPDEVDYEANPYIVIRDLNTLQYLEIGPNPFTAMYNPSNGIYYLGASAEMKVLQYHFYSDKWNYAGELTDRPNSLNGIMDDGSTYKGAWANHDLYLYQFNGIDWSGGVGVARPATPLNTIYLSASEPVPVYE